MVRMSQDWKTVRFLVEMHGNNGSMDDPPAAMRYTEARLSEIAGYLLQDIERIQRHLPGTFDDTEKSQQFLLKLPKSLGQWATGISAGYATDIPPHNLAGSHRWGLHDRPSICQGRQAHGVFYLGTFQQVPLSKDGMRSRKPMKPVSGRVVVRF